MKRFLLFLFLFTITANSINANNSKIRMRPNDIFIVDLFIDFWQDEPDNLNLKFFNRGINIVLSQDFPLGYSNFSIAPGLGFSSNNMYSDNSYLYSDNIDGFDFIPLDKNINFSNNKINLNYINIPLELRYRTRLTQRRPNSFRITAGGRIGYMVQAHTKYKGDYFLDNEIGSERSIKFKEYKLNNIDSWNYGLMGRIGYGNYVNAYVYYPLNSIFKENRAKDMYPISAGVSFIIF